MPDGVVLIVGGTGGLGRELAARYRERGSEVIITGRDAERASAVAAEIGEGVTGLGFHLSHPETIAGALADVGPVSRLVLAAISRDNNPIHEYDIAGAIDLVTMKLVGYTETVHTLLDRLSDDSSIVLFGGRAKDRPYPGSTTVTTVNGGISALVRTLAIQLAPIRINAIHPGIVGDSPFWEGKPLDAVVARTPTGRLASMTRGRRRHGVPARESGDERRGALRRRWLDVDVMADVTTTAAGEPQALDRIGDRLREERVKAGISQRELARRLGLSASLISQLESGQSRPSVGTLYLIVTELGVSLDDVIRGEESAAPSDGNVEVASNGSPVLHPARAHRDRPRLRRAVGGARGPSRGRHRLPRGDLRGGRRVDDRPLADPAPGAGVRLHHQRHAGRADRVPGARPEPRRFDRVRLDHAAPPVQRGR